MTPEPDHKSKTYLDGEQTIALHERATHLK
jgi:hypothetical protein